MDQKQLTEIEALIRQETEKTEKTVEDYRELTKPIVPENSIGRVSRMDAINNRSVTEAALRSAEKKLQGLKNILPKVREEGFGKCARCEGTIPLGRILLMPQSPYCVRCAQ